MHTKKYDNVRFIHDGDYSGNVTITYDPGTGPVNSSTIPVSALVQFVADVVRDRKLRQLEDATAADLLGLNGL